MLGTVSYRVLALAVVALCVGNVVYRFEELSEARDAERVGESLAREIEELAVLLIEERGRRLVSSSFGVDEPTLDSLDARIAARHAAIDRHFESGAFPDRLAGIWRRWNERTDQPPAEATTKSAILHFFAGLSRVSSLADLAASARIVRGGALAPGELLPADYNPRQALMLVDATGQLRALSARPRDEQAIDDVVHGRFRSWLASAQRFVAAMPDDDPEAAVLREHLAALEDAVAALRARTDPPADIEAAWQRFAMGTTPVERASAFLDDVARVRLAHWHAKWEDRRRQVLARNAVALAALLSLVGLAAFSGRRRAEARFANRQIELLTEAFASAISVQDIATGAITLSDGARAFFDLDERSLGGVDAIQEALSGRVRQGREEMRRTLERVRAAEIGSEAARAVLEFEIADPQSGEEGRWMRGLTAKTLGPSGRPVIVSWILDVDAEKRLERARDAAEEALRIQGEHLALAFESVGMGSWEVDRNEVRIDDNVRQLFGLSEDQAVDSYEPLHACVVEADRDLVGVDAAKDASATRQFRIVRPRDGALRWISARIVSEWNERGEFVWSRGVSWDATDEREMREQLEQAVAELAEKNEELERFAYIASHDLQTPLRAIAGFAELLAENDRGRDPQASEYVDRILSSVTSMRTMIRDLLAYSQAGPSADDIEPVDLSEVLTEVLSRLGDASVADAEIHVGPLPRVLGVRTPLVQVFQNLIENALKYRGEDPARVRVSARRAGDDWRIEVADDGIGIAPQHHERIFEVFRRLHGNSSYQGTGVGLAICNRIVTQLGGRIGVESKPGAGATFWLTLRDAEATADARATHARFGDASSEPGSD